MDLLKGAEILRSRFERDGHVERPLEHVDASALPVYRWCGVQPSPPAEDKSPKESSRRGRGSRAAVSTLRSR
jgi:hypothetical protein